MTDTTRDIWIQFDCKSNTNIHNKKHKVQVNQTGDVDDLITAIVKKFPKTLTEPTDIASLKVITPPSANSSSSAFTESKVTSLVNLTTNKVLENTQELKFALPDLSDKSRPGGSENPVVVTVKEHGGIKRAGDPIHESEAKKRKIDKDFRRPLVVINGSAISGDNCLVLPSADCSTIFTRISTSSVSVASYLAGPYATGKTNTLSQLYWQCRSSGYVSVFINGDIKFMNDKWNLLEEGLLKIDFVKEYVISLGDKYKQSTLLQRVNFCSNAFTTANDKLQQYCDIKVVVCVDEAQNFVANDKKKYWEQVVRELVRGRSNTWVVCATSSFEISFPTKLNQENSVESPFDKHVYAVSYFSKDQIQSALVSLQGDKDSSFFVDLSQLLPSMVNTIFSETQGHPGLCAHYFLVIREILNKISSETYNIETSKLPAMWQYGSDVQVYANLRDFRLADKIKEVNLGNELETSGLLYDTAVQFTNDEWQKLVLRLGLAKLGSDKTTLALSCNVMRKLYLDTKSMTTNLPRYHIFSMCKTAGALDLMELIKFLFRNLKLPSLLRQESWVTDRWNKKKKGPSEKTYQAQFYTTLSSICTTPWFPVYEMSRGQKEKVDLGLIYTPEENTVTKYLLELGVNLAPKGDGTHSCESHYNRQVERYTKSDIAHSIVIMVFTNKHESDYYWPVDNHSNVSYVTVEHFLGNGRDNLVKVFLSKNSSFELTIPNPNE